MTGERGRKPLRNRIVAIVDWASRTSADYLPKIAIPSVIPAEEPVPVNVCNGLVATVSFRRNRHSTARRWPAPSIVER